jgi:hypothetical protein
MWQAEAVVERLAVLLHSANRTVAVPIGECALAGIPMAVVCPLDTARAVDMGQFGYQAPKDFRQPEHATGVIGNARMTELRSLCSVNEARVPRT